MSADAPSCPAPRGLGARPGLSLVGAPTLRLLAEVASSLLVGALLLASHRQPWWSFRLYAPQYPQGLALDILLHGARGDVREIDTLNHYIGMASLASAAPLERQWSLVAIEATALLVTALLLVPRRPLNLLGVAVVAAVPLGFVADVSYWLYRFGHELNPRAPLRLEPFTPDMFGNGVIGQFMTFARPELGFWLAASAACLAGLLVGLRERRTAGLGRS